MPQNVRGNLVQMDKGLSALCHGSLSPLMYYHLHPQSPQEHLNDRDSEETQQKSAEKHTQGDLRYWR